MKTLEERADAYCKEIFTNHEYMKPRTESLAKACYIDGATEQMALDEEYHTTEVMRLGKEYADEMRKLNKECEDSYTSAAAGYEMGANEQKAIDDMRYNKLKTLATNLYNSIQYMSTDARKVREAADALQHYVVYEEEE